MGSPDIEPIIVGLVIWLLSTIWLIVDRGLAMRRKGYADHGLRIGTTILGWIVFCISSLALSAIISLGAGILGWMVAAGCVITAMARQRDRYRRSFMKLLSAAFHRRTPLDPMLEAFAVGVPPRYRRRIEWMQFYLKQGCSLTTAARQAGRLIAKNDLALLAVGEKGGRTDLAVDMIIESRREFAPLIMSVFGQIFYFLIIIQAFLGIGLFIFAKIIPQYIKIFDSFGVEMPMMTQSVISASSIMPDELLAIFAMLFTLSWPLIAIYLILRMNEIFVWDPPGLRWLVWRMNRESICRSLSLGTRLRIPMIDTMVIMSDHGAKRYIRRRLDWTINYSILGLDTIEAMRRSKLLYKSDLDIITMAERSDSLDSALLALADRRRQQAIDRAETTFQIGGPLFIGVVSFVIMVVAVGLFLPLVTLIQRLT